MEKKKAQKCPKGNTEPLGRVRWFPNFTSFLETEPVFNDKYMKYLCFGEEVCPKTQRKHWQGCVYFFNKVSIKTAQKYLCIGNSHMESFQKSDNEEDAVEYCKKDGNFKEYGIFPQQGKRNDLDILKNDIMEGNCTAEDIMLENPIIYHQYGRTLDKIEDIALRRKFRTEMTEGIWYYGRTGVGKSHITFEGFNPDTHYNVPNDKGWWDGYRQQEVVILNDFRGDIAYNELLQLVDKFPYNVRRRGREPMPFTSKKVIITSSLHPSEVYKNRNEKDSIEQLYRRFRVVEL